MREPEKSFGDNGAVNGVSLHIEQGETYGLLGPNGAGILIVVGVLAAVSVTALVASFTNTFEQAGSAQSVVALEIFPDVLRTIARVTPHAWGNDAFATLLQDDGGLGDILNELGILAAYAAGLPLISSWLFRRNITAG